MLREFEKHKQWKSVKEVCARLKGSGHQALLAGGCVRDVLMNREPNDFDIATDATPDQVHALYPNSLTVGKAFGVTIVPFPGYQIEVATFRVDLEYKDGRRPEGVKFSTPEEDAKRRDFTVNALFMDPESGKVVDFVNGERDIRSGVIRTVGEPKKRFNEDRLRLMRAVRFAAQLDFEIEPNTFASIIELAPEVAGVSRERIRDELFKLLKAPARVKGLGLLLSTGLLQAAFPDLAQSLFTKDETQWLKQFEILSEMDSEKALLQQTQLALFLQPVWNEPKEHEFRERQLRSLRLDNRLAENIVFTMKHSHDFLFPERVRKGEMALLLTHDAAQGALVFASVMERASHYTPVNSLTEREKLLNEIAKSSLDASGEKQKAFLTGMDLKSQGITAGPEMGALLHEALLLQLEGHLKSRSDALAWLKKRQH